ncbi:MAG TPA: hypothetical protein VF839_06900 [Clostridium sp.]
MIKVLNPKNDVVFQKLFGMKAHKNILISRKTKCNLSNKWIEKGELL